MNNVIEVKHLTKFYGKERCITDLSLAVSEGDIFGFMGPNGAGKSTTIRQLMGLITPTSGEMRLFGKECTKHQTELRSRIGYMPAEAMFYPTMKVEEVINLAAKLNKKDCRKVADSLCERLQVDKRKRIDALSLGNRKKISIICAMQHQPDLYILDEPTSGLDPLMQKEFFDLLLEQHKKGATIFLSSHILTEIQRYCKNVAIVREGKLIALDTVEQLAKNHAKKIRITGISELPELPGCMDFIRLPEGISFLFSGKMPQLISILNGLPVEDLMIEEPSLEEIFMRFYEKEDK